jgi:hypothetical protein
VRRHLETPEELTSVMRNGSGEEALTCFTDWLERRDDVTGQVAMDQLAAVLDTLADEIRTENAQGNSPRTPGLVVAAAVLTDTANDVRAGDELPDRPVLPAGTVAAGRPAR